MQSPESALTRPTRLDPRGLLQLLKPITWFPPMWAFGCGVVSSGMSPAQMPWAIVAGVILAGPMVCGASQIVNDWFDRHVDAINEPERPIPSGRVPGRIGLYYAIIWSLLCLLLAATLGAVVFWATVLGLVLAWAYSAPPARLKLNGWWGNAAVGFSYEGLAWVTGAAVMLGGAMPANEILILAVLYSLGAHGIMTLNDFKAIEGDLQLGVRSIPAQLGPDRAARLACVVMLVPQVVVVLLLLSWDKGGFAAAIGVGMLLQLWAMRRLLTDPKGLAPWYNGTGVTLYVLGMLVAAFAVRGLPGVGA
ncbi:chlorophyll synthase ChlG [Chromatocurvus halotolerans]|nr:chlorophyll synthase ChlG [Chromatocurvus halotolerans]